MKPAKMAGVESRGMVMCAAKDGKFELLRPPAGAKVGEQVTYEGVAECAKGTPNAMAKKKVVPNIIKDGGLKTTADCMASWRGHVMVTSAGAVTVPTFIDAPIS